MTQSEELKRLLAWTPETVPIQFQKEHNPYNASPYDSEDVTFSQEELDADARMPFFCEAYLYNLLGKEDARTLLALMRKFVVSVGMRADF